jgi:hypothetical protein
MGALLVVVIVVAALLWLARGTHRRASLRTPERQLARMLGADAAERLIRFEQERQPGLSRARAAQRALERAEYDRGR